MARNSTIHMTISEPSLQRLEALKIKTESEDVSEVIANALRLYEWAVARVGEEDELYLKKKNGSFTPVAVFGTAGKSA